MIMGIADSTIKEILEAGAAAPSGDNCQPWRFEIEKNTIRLFNVPDRDTSLFNYRQRASLVAHGALIENMSIVASVHGLRSEIVLFPNPAERVLVAEMRLVSGEEPTDPLAAVIHSRCTNRRRYLGGELTEQQRAQLTATSRFAGVRVRLFTGGEQERLARIIGLNDRLVFENSELHGFLFDHIRWSPSEAKATRDGMDIRTLELAPPDALAFRMFKSFDFVRFLNHFGISRIIDSNARKLAMSAAAVGVITMPSTEPRDYITCGRAMERVWLEATHQGLAFQLMTGITCLIGRVIDGDPGTLSPAQVIMVQNGRLRLVELLGSENEIPMIIFRVGTAKPPTARSLRLSGSI